MQWRAVDWLAHAWCRKLFLMSLETGRPKIKVLAGLGSGGALTFRCRKVLGHCVLTRPLQQVCMCAHNGQGSHTSRKDRNPWAPAYG